MKAVSFDVSVPAYVLARTLGRVTDAAVFGRLSGLSFGEALAPELPGDRWVALDVILSGICGTDLSALTFSMSPALEPFASFPAVPGHEVLAEVSAVGPGVTRVEVGQRVVLDPVLSCAVRGYAEDPCPSCGEGLPATCGRAGEPGALEVNGRLLAPGSLVGYHRDLPGGWGERAVAHEDQVFPVAEELADRVAVLIEPLSIAVHAVLRSPPEEGQAALVIGSGPIALGVVWALRALGFGGYLLAQTRRRHEANLARALGATECVSPGPRAREALIGTGARPYEAMLGAEVYGGGGFPLVFDCVGSRSSVSQALRFAAPRGRIVLLGCAARMRNVDLTFLWARELEVKGFVGYGRERWRGGERHTFEVTRDLLAETTAPVADMVTHVFPLDQYGDALSAAAHRRKSGAVKVLLEP